MVIKTEPFVLNVGPVHPSTHGVYRMRLTLDGEVVIDVEPVIGYLHRGIEKLTEERTYTGVIPLTDRLDYTSSMSNNLAYCMAVEKLAEITVPERAEYIRVIIAELQRIANHLVAVGSFFNDSGAYFTPFLHMFREREKIIDLFEMVSGQRLTYNYMRIGGISQDIPDDFMPALNIVLEQLPKAIDVFDTFLKDNEILLARAKGVGILDGKTAINYSITGPVLRATGVEWDLRKADPYSIYDRF
ncbi:NADH-quinone oxidoreductase subunit D, partial [Chloroflexota bacterium]